MDNLSIDGNAASMEEGDVGMFMAGIGTRGLGESGPFATMSDLQFRASLDSLLQTLENQPSQPSPYIAASDDTATTVAAQHQHFMQDDSLETQSPWLPSASGNGMEEILRS
jgi:hypothetical protein